MHRILLALLLSAPPLLAANDSPAPPAKWGDWPRWGDQMDGTYRNPVLPADFSDLDCIGVNGDYYAISSTMQYSPGMVVLHSIDMVNWEIVGHVVDDLTTISPAMGCAQMNRWGKGVWAGSIRYHDNKFWVYFCTPDEGYFMSTASNPAGPWTPLQHVLKEGGWDDCCSFWDDDGQGYLVGTHFKDGYKTWLFKLTPDGTGLLPDFRVLLNEGGAREANKLYKINGTYYHLFSENDPKTGRFVMMQRASSIAGPYTERKKLSHAQREAHEPNQGGLLETPDGAWYFFTHHGNGDWEGRGASLLPVHWIDGWPILGEPGADGIGMMVWGGRKPIAQDRLLRIRTSDDFAGPNLGTQWEWNYQPLASMWSLSESPGALRLHAFKALRGDNLRFVGNMLTQRAFRTAKNTVTVKLGLDGMSDGQVAGLCHYGRGFGGIVVCQENGSRSIESRNDQGKQRVAPIEKTQIWLRSEWDLLGLSQFSYSFDGETFTPAGELYKMTWGDYRGDRVGLFTYNNAATAGWVDFSRFEYLYDSLVPRTK